MKVRHFLRATSEQLRIKLRSAMGNPPPCVHEFQIEPAIGSWLGGPWLSDPSLEAAI